MASQENLNSTEHTDTVLTPMETQVAEFKELIRQIDTECLVSLEQVAATITPLLHDQWSKTRRNELIQIPQPEVHFRLAYPASRNAIEFVQLNKMIADWKKNNPQEQWRVVEVEGKTEFQIDILNVPFEKLTPKWKQSNADGARRVARIVHTRLEQGPLAESDLPVLAEEVHIGWMLDPVNIWKLEKAKRWGNEAAIQTAMAAMTAWNRDPTTPDEKKKVLEAIYTAAKSIVVPEVSKDSSDTEKEAARLAAEIQMQFGPYSEMSESEKLKDMEQVVAAVRGSIPHKGTRS